MNHSVFLVLPEQWVGNADVVFRVKRNDESIGTLKVSKGSIVWVPKKLTYGFKLPWAKFDVAMREAGEREGR